MANVIWYKLVVLYLKKKGLCNYRKSGYLSRMWVFLTYTLYANGSQTLLAEGLLTGS